MKNKKAFTLIELLVVIAIIGILATLAIVALQQARQNARDAKRVADVKQMSTALEMYFNEHQAYPESLDDLKEAGYMQIIPEAPIPADKGCGDSNDYNYSVSNNKDYYQLRFCTGKQVADLSPGNLCMTPGGLSINCEGSMSKTSCLTNPEGCEWVEVGVTGFSVSYPLGERNIYINNGNVYVFFKDSSFSGAGTVKKFNGTSWETLGEPGFTVDNIGDSSIAGVGDKIYVSFQEQNGPGQGKLSVMEYKNGTWSYVGQRGVSSGQGTRTSLKIYNNVLYVAYLEESEDYVNYKVKVMKYNGSSWESIGETNCLSTAFLSIPLSMSIDNSGVVYVAYIDNATKKANVIKYNGSAWEHVGSPNFSEASVREVLLDISDDGTPFLAYTVDYSNAVVVKFDDGNWIDVNSSLLPSVGHLRIFTKNNVPYLTFSDGSYSGQGRASAMKLSGGTWEYIGNAGFSDSYSNFSSGYIDNGTIYISFIEEPNTNYKVMKYSKVTPCSSHTNQDICSYNGDVYRVVKIGSQTWFADNLNTSLYNDGVTEIEFNHDTWNDGTWGDPAWSWPGDSATVYQNYGKLYNAFAVETGNLCPPGWHVPTHSEFAELEIEVCNLIGGSDCEDTFSWIYEGTHGDEEASALAGEASMWDPEDWSSSITDSPHFGVSGFNALPLGLRNFGYSPAGFGTNSYFWTATNKSEYYSWARYMRAASTYISGAGRYRADGYAVRCLKD